MYRLLWMHNFKKNNNSERKFESQEKTEIAIIKPVLFFCLTFFKLNATFNSFNQKYRRKVVFLKAKYDSDFTEDMPRLL